MLHEANFLKLAPMIMLKGMTVAVNSSIYVNYWVSMMNSTDQFKDMTEDEKNEMAAVTYNTLGAGCIVGGLLIGWI